MVGQQLENPLERERGLPLKEKLEETARLEGEIWGVIWKSSAEKCQKYMKVNLMKSSRLLPKQLVAIHKGFIPEDNTRTTHWTWNIGAEFYLEPTILLFYCLWYERYLAGYQKRNIKTKPATKTFVVQSILPSNHPREHAAQSLKE